MRLFCLNYNFITTYNSGYRHSVLDGSQARTVYNMLETFFKDEVPEVTSGDYLGAWINFARQRGWIFEEKLQVTKRKKNGEEVREGERKKIFVILFIIFFVVLISFYFIL